MLLVINKLLVYVINVISKLHKIDFNFDLFIIFFIFLTLKNPKIVLFNYISNKFVDSVFQLVFILNLNVHL